MERHRREAPSPASGGGLGRGLSPRWDRRELRKKSPSGESPHPPRAGRCWRIARVASASPASGRGGSKPPSPPDVSKDEALAQLSLSVIRGSQGQKRTT